MQGKVNNSLNSLNSISTATIMIAFVFSRLSESNADVRRTMTLQQK